MPPPKSQNQRHCETDTRRTAARGPCQKHLPIDGLGIDVELVPLPARLIAIPGEMHFVNIADLPGLDDLVGFLKLRMLRCCVATLYDAAMIVLRGDHRGAFAQIVRQRLLNIHVLAAAHAATRQRHVPVIGRTDDHGVDVLAIEQGPIIFLWQRPWGRPAS